MRIAIIQMEVRCGAEEWNLSNASKWIQEAANKGAELVVLPEAMNLGWTDPSAYAAADSIPNGKCFEILRSLAARQKVFVTVGLVERFQEKIFNSAVLLGNNGDLLIHYRKINELDLAHSLYQNGSKLEVAQTPLGCIGLMICADAFAPHQVIARSLAHMQADIILTPCAWAVPQDHDNTLDAYGGLWLRNYQPVARDYKIWIAAASNVGAIAGGPWAGRKCIGNSLLVDPAGEVAWQGPYGENAETMFVTDIKMEPRPFRGTLWGEHLGFTK